MLSWVSPFKIWQTKKRDRRKKRRTEINVDEKWHDEKMNGQIIVITKNYPYEKNAETKKCATKYRPTKKCWTKTSNTGSLLSTLAPVNEEALCYIESVKK